MWGKALRTIPRISKEEWQSLDIVSQWLIATRSAVFIMTAIAGIIGGLMAWYDGTFLPWNFVAALIGIVFAHASNNLINDLIDSKKGIDKGNYYRSLYGPQTVEHKLLSNAGIARFIGFSLIIALLAGAFLIWQTGMVTFYLMIIGLFFLLFYTWPLKYIALGEVAVLLVWGPLMIGGGYYVLAGHWDWSVIWASIPYYFGVTTVIFGKHIDKIQVDKEKRIYTLPVLLGEKLSRFAVLGMLVAPYLLVLAMILTRYFTPVMLVVFLALPTLRSNLPHFLKPKPATRPEWFPESQGGWPLFFAPLAFQNNRAFGGLFMLGLLVDVLLRLFLPAFWH